MTRKPVSRQDKEEVEEIATRLAEIFVAQLDEQGQNKGRKQSKKRR